MINNLELKARLDQFVEGHLPLGRAMGLEVSEYDGQSLSLSAPLELNDNDKGTAFGGSLYCAAVMAGWGYFYLRCLQYKLNEGAPNIVISKSEIEYLAPVDANTITATCSDSDPIIWDAFLSRYQERGKAKVELSATIKTNINGVEKIAVKFTGTFALIGFTRPTSLA
jgi:thioesterase domain-containing protein